QRYYNSTGPSAIKLIQKANPELKDPDHVSAGMKLLIPDRATMPTQQASGHGPEPAKAKPADAKAKPAVASRTNTAPAHGASTVPATYRVQQNDSLSSIAQHFYGDRARRKEIYALNKNVIGADPDMLQPGMVLKLPAARAAASQPKR